MNAVFTKRDNEDVQLHYENLIFFCRKINRSIYLIPADHYTGTMLDCEPGTVRGMISEFGVKKIRFEFRDDDGGYEAECLFTYQTSCMPWLADILYPGKSMF